MGKGPELRMAKLKSIGPLLAGLGIVGIIYASTRTAKGATTPVRAIGPDELEAKHPLLLAHLQEEGGLWSKLRAQSEQLDSPQTTVISFDGQTYTLKAFPDGSAEFYQGVSV